MEAEDPYAELGPLVVSFLQQTIKENPRGFALREFERKFPEGTDEPHDWYKRYHKNTTVEALQCIPGDVVLNNYRGEIHISLNPHSKHIDRDLVDLIQNQRASNKKRTKNGYSRPSHRIVALRSFNLNRQYSSGHSGGGYRQPARLNYEQQYRGDQFIRRSSELPPPSAPVSRPPSIYENTTPTKWMASNDPRQSRTSSAPSPMVPPQVRLPTQPKPAAVVSSPAPSQPQPHAQPQTPIRPPDPPETSVQKPTLSAVGRPRVSRPSDEEQHKEEDPAMVAKKNHLRQRLISLITRKAAEIKIFHLASLYQLDYHEEIDWKSYNHQSLASLLQDPIVSESIQINYRSLFSTISIRPKIQSSDKENIGLENRPDGMTNGHSISTTKDKLNAVDPFNVKPMLHSLEPLGNIKEPPLKDWEIEEIVKFKTMRMVFKGQNSTLKLDDWDTKFEQENRIRVRIRDYGCKTVLEFFKRLSVDIPIKLQNLDGQWVAIADLGRLNPWLREKMEANQFRALQAIDSRYELIAFPDDVYTYTDIKDVLHPSYQPAHILSVKRSDSMWIQLRTPKRIEDHNCLDSSMMCYQDYNEKKIIPLPRHFIRPGFPCAVFDRNMARWCRGLVLKREKRGDDLEINILLVDYGFEKTYGSSDLSVLMRTHLKFPVGSIYSKLSGVQDLNSIKVQRNAKMILQEYINPPATLACKFLGSAPASKNPPYLPKMVAEVILVDTRQGKDCNLADDINVPHDSCDCDDSGDVSTPSESMNTFIGVTNV